MSNQFIPVIFHKHTLFFVEKDGQPYVVMKPVVEGMGLAWGAQQQKLRKHARKYGCIDIDIPSNGGVQQTLCIPLTNLHGWLFSVNETKVKPELRDTVYMYQQECFPALYDYWTKGVAIQSNALAHPDSNKFHEVLRALGNAIDDNKMFVNYTDVWQLSEIMHNTCEMAKYLLRSTEVVNEIRERMEKESGRPLLNYMNMEKK